MNDLGTAHEKRADLKPSRKSVSLPEALSSDEIFDMTGKVQPAAQIRHLRRMGIKAERSDNPDKPVLVCRAWLAIRSAPVAQSSAKPKQRWERGATA